MGLAGPHIMRTAFVWEVLKESQKVWRAHARAHYGLIKAWSGPRGTMAMARALQELQLHQEAEWQGVPQGCPELRMLLTRMLCPPATGV